MTTPTDTYREAGHRLLARARNELEAGDLRQASEKGWGAAAQMVKAVAAARGWQHDQHRHLFLAVRELTRESGDQETHDLFMFANALHGNFYENTFDAAIVRNYLDRASRFAAKLDELLDA